MKHRYKKKYSKGSQEILANQSAQRGVVSSVVTTAADAALPGLGQAVGVIDSISSGLAKDEKGLYKNKFAQVADSALNPVTRINNSINAAGKLFQGDFKGAGKAFIGDQSELKESMEKERIEAVQKKYAETITGTDYTQGQTRQYKKGAGDINVAHKTKPIEVEKDELVFDRDWNLKADFKGGKSHSQGGEDYVAVDGDIIFPGKQREEVLAKYKAKDIKALEQMRSKLPKDKPVYKYQTGTREIEDDPEVPTIKAVLGKNFDPNAKPEVRGGWLAPKGQRYSRKNDPVINSIDSAKGAIKSSLVKGTVYDPARQKPYSGTPTPFKPKETAVPFKGLDYKPASTSNKATPVPPKKTSTPKASPTKVYKKTSPSKAVLPPVVSTIKATTDIDPDFASLKGVETLSKAQTEGRAAEASYKFPDKSTGNSSTSGSANQGGSQGTSKIGNMLGGAGKYASIANNLVQGLKPAEKVKRNYVRSNTIGYNDMSDPARRESRSAMKGQIDNARNLSGGSAGNARSNAANAYAQNADRIDRINQGEAARFDAVAEKNTQIKNQDKFFNAQVDAQADDMEARNRAAKQSYIDTAMADVSTVAQINEQTKYMKQRDAKADAMDEKQLNLYNSTSPYKVDKDLNVYHDPSAPGAAFGMGRTGVKTESKTGNTKTTTQTYPVVGSRSRKYKRGTKSIKTYKKK